MPPHRDGWYSSNTCLMMRHNLRHTPKHRISFSFVSPQHLFFRISLHLLVPEALNRGQIVVGYHFGRAERRLRLIQQTPLKCQLACEVNCMRTRAASGRKLNAVREEEERQSLACRPVKEGGVPNLHKWAEEAGDEVKPSRPL